MSGIGTLGELWVIDYFSKNLKMATYLPFKDKGIDFIATKGEKFFQIQVKTSKLQKDKYFWFDLYKSKLIFNASTFYVFVCAVLPRRSFMGKKRNFIVIPSLKLKEWIEKDRLITKKGDSNCYNIFIYPDSEKKQWVFRNKGKEIDLTDYWNNYYPFE